jgi:hypothetical protein
MIGRNMSKDERKAAAENIQDKMSGSRSDQVLVSFVSRESEKPQIDMLDSKYKNPTVNDLINSFVYVSEQTEGKTSELYFSADNHLMFGGGKSINLKNRAEAVPQEELVEFLVNSKRRQFKLSMWNENGAYRKYVLDNKIISTDGTIDGPLFQNTRKRTNRFIPSCSHFICR